MIRPIQITLNAAHPELPLIEASTYVGSPSTAFVRGVPAAIGNWKITAVRVIFHYPDESVVAAACVNSATGVWVGTIAPTATSGRVANGYQILADGTDENGDAVTGYVLGMGDLAVYTRDMTIDAGETFWYFHYFDTAPTTPKKSDVAHVDGVLKFYNGSAWESFAAGITLDDAVTLTSANGVKSSGIWAAIWGALAALPTGFSSLYDWCVAQLSGKASTADATLNLRGPNKDGFSAWTIKRAGVDVTEQARQPEYLGEITEGLYLWRVYVIEGDDGQTQVSTTDGGDAVFLEWSSSGGMYTATRTALPGYQLGSQSSKPLASEAEAEALRAEVAGIVASISQKANAADLRYSFNAATVGTGTTPTVTNVLDRAINYATLGSTVTAATVTLPAATTGRSRDFYIDLTIEATTAPTLIFIDPATSTTATISFGADALADIDTGDNLVLWTELPNNRWLVSVKHEEAT